MTYLEKIDLTTMGMVLGLNLGQLLFGKNTIGRGTNYFIIITFSILIVIFISL